MLHTNHYSIHDVVRVIVILLCMVWFRFQFTSADRRHLVSSPDVNYKKDFLKSCHSTSWQLLVRMPTCRHNWPHDVNNEWRPSDDECSTIAAGTRSDRAAPQQKNTQVLFIYRIYGRLCAPAQSSVRRRLVVLPGRQSRWSVTSLWDWMWRVSVGRSP